MTVLILALKVLFPGNSFSLWQTGMVGRPSDLPPPLPSPVSSIQRLLGPRSCFSNFSLQQHHLKGWIKHGFLGPNPTVSDSGGLEWGPGISVPNKFPSETGAAGPGTTLWEPCPRSEGLKLCYLWESPEELKEKKSHYLGCSPDHIRISKNEP